MAIRTIIVTLLAIGLSVSAHAQAPDANSIITKAYEAKRVDDQIAKLTFTFSAPGKSDQQVIYTMVWKNMHNEDGFDNKAMFFTEFPPDKKGIAYLGWLRAAASTQDDDEWLYLPELRTTRRIAHRDHAHAHDDDEFGNSVLQRQHLDPRPPDLDDHTLVGEEVLDGEIHYVVASSPKQHHNQPEDHLAHDTPGKVIRWIEKASHRTHRTQFFDAHENATLDMRIRWIQTGDYWVWQDVSAVDPRSHAKTTMEISNMKINSGLTSSDFSKRSLEKGSGRFR